MDSRLFNAVRWNDVESFMNLVGNNAEILKQRSEPTRDTALHVAARHGHVELVKEIIRLCPETVAAENLMLETPFHEACRQGHAGILLLLLETDPWASSKLNHQNQSLMFVACSGGHVDVIKILLNQRWLQNLEDDAGGLDPACFLEAVSRGHLGVVKELLANFPKMADKDKVDDNGHSALHLACLSGHAEVASFLLLLRPQLALQFNNSGYLPVHLIAMNGQTAIFEDFLQLAPRPFHYRTKQGDPIIFLTVHYNQFDAFLFLLRTFDHIGISHFLDHDGNTLLHVSVLRRRVKFVEYLIDNIRLPINSQNNEGLTALDVLDQLAVKGMDEFQVLEDMLRNAGGKRRRELTNSTIPTRKEEEKIHSFNRNSKDHPRRINVDDHEGETKMENSVASNIQVNDEVEENTLNDQATEENKNGSVPNNLKKQKRLSRERRKLLKTKMDNNRSRRQKQHDMYKEALQNARNTVTLVAALIATVTFSAGISPPGGVHQDGPLTGKAVFGKTKGYTVFVISNSVALSTSLCIMLVLVSIIPFKRRLLLRLLMITHKVMWVSLAFMATAFTSATWLTLPQDYKAHWLPNLIMAVVGGIMGTLFIYMGLALVKHWMRKLKWRRERARKNSVVVPVGSNNSDGNVDVESTDDLSCAANSDVERQMRLYSFSTNSDVASSRFLGGHPV